MPINLKGFHSAKVKKIAAVTGLSLLGILLLAGAAVLYLYFHPDKLLPYLVKIIAQQTHTTCEIRELNLSSRPWHIQMKGLTFKPDQEGRGFDLSVPAVDLDLAFTGSFGDRTLVIQKVTVAGPSLKLGRDFSLPQLVRGSEKPSFSKRIFNFLFFREISFQTAKVTDGDLNLTLPDQTAQIKDLQMELKSGGLLEITCGGEIQWPSRGRTLLFPQIYLSTDRPAANDLFNAGVRLQIPDATLEGSDLRIAKIGLDIKFQYRPDQKQFDDLTLDLHIERIFFKEFRTANPLRLDLNLSGIFKLQEFELQVPKWALSLNEMNEKTAGASAPKAAAPNPDLLASQGSLACRLLPDPRLDLRISGGKVLAQKLLASLPVKIKKHLNQLNFSGPLDFQGQVQTQKKENQWLGQCDLKAVCKQNPASWTDRTFRCSALLNADLRVRGALPAPVLSVDLETTHTELSGPALKGIEIRPFQSHWSLNGTYPLFQLSAADIRMPQIKFKPAGPEYLFRDTLIQIGKGQVNVAKIEGSLPEINLESSGIKGLSARLAMQNREISLELMGQKLELLKPLQDLKWLPAAWRLQGTNDLELKVRSDATLRKWSYMLRFECREYAFEIPGGDGMGEKIQAVLESEGRLELGKSFTVKSDVQVRIPEGEILCGPYYADLKAAPFSGTAELDYDSGRRTLVFSAARLEMKNLIALEWKGLTRHPGWDLDLSLAIPSVPVQPVFEQFVREPFKTKKPFLNNLSLTGTVSGRATLKKQGTRQSCKGSLQWQNGEAILSKGDLALKGLNLDLPVWYVKNSTRPQKTTLKGALKIQSLKLPWVPEQPLNLSFAVGPNRVAISSATLLKIKGGAVEIGPLLAKNIYSATPQIDTSLNLNTLDLRPLFSGLWNRPVSGSASGRLNKVVFDGHSLTTQGKIKAELFKGQVTISDIGMDRLFGSNPVLKLNAAWENLNMLEMTKDTEFGAVQGILQGYAKGLEIAAAQPQKFELLVESVPKKGVAQKISLRAVDNIARIGGGQSPFVGMAVVYAAFIQELSYKKIGIKAHLENDTFRINGTTKEGGTEYFIAKGGLLGVNIVNQTPGLPVGFKDMIKRIKGIFAASGGPLIK